MAKTIKKFALIASLFISYFVNGQCNPVCGTVHIAGGTSFTITPSGTQSVAPAAGTTFTMAQKAGTTFTIDAKGTYTVATTYSIVSVSGTNTITSGALSVSISNVGANGALFNGSTLPAGATINLDIPNAILPQYTYNCLTSSLIILVNR